MATSYYNQSIIDAGGYASNILYLSNSTFYKDIDCLKFKKS